MDLLPVITGSFGDNHAAMLARIFHEHFVASTVTYGILLIILILFLLENLQSVHQRQADAAAPALSLSDQA